MSKLNGINIIETSITQNDNNLPGSYYPKGFRSQSKMFNELKISSYNCRGLPKDPKKLLLRPDIIDVFGKSDVVAI